MFEGMTTRRLWCLDLIRQNWLLLLLAALSYYVAAQCSMQLGLPNSRITPIWFPAPIAWSIFYLGGAHLWPGIFLGELCINLPRLAQQQPLAIAVGATVLKGMISTTIPWLGSWMMRRLLIGRILDRVRNILLFSLLSATLPLITPTLSLLVFCAFNITPWQRYGDIWLTWWIGDSLSVVIVMPMLVTWRRFTWSQVRWHKLPDCLGFIAALVSIPTISHHWQYPLDYLMIPVLLWAALRLGDVGATAGIVGATLIALISTALGKGPFQRTSVNESLILLQTFMATITLTTLLMLSVLAEKRKTQFDLARANEQLEARVRDRTEGLEAALQDLRQTQSQLVQTEKMTSLGQLVAGLAHEINNPISFIYGNLPHVQTYSQDLLDIIQAYQRQCPTPNSETAALLEKRELEYIREDFPQLLASMQSGADRIRQLILTLRNFSRLDEGGLKRVNIHDGLESTLLVLNYRLNQMSHGYPIRVEKSYGDLPEVECYADEMNQVFMHVLNNAIDCVIEHHLPAPVLRVTTRWHSEKEQIEIQIWNDGPPIPQSILDRMFDPFFTTKPIGQGTGLGLAISQRIVVDKHGGSLQAHSAPGQGTEIQICIPIKQAWIV